MNAQDIIKKYKLTKHTWTHKGMHSNLHYFFPVGVEPVKPLFDYFGDSYSFTIFFVHERYMDWYWNDQEMTRLRESFIKKVNEDSNFLTNWLDEWHKRIAKFNQIMNKIDETNLEKLSENDLFNLYKEWFEAYIQEYGLAIGIQDAFSMHADRFLIPHFKKILPKDKFDEYYLALISSVDETFLSKEYKERAICKDIKKHVKKWHWLRNNYARAIYLDEKFFLDNPADENEANRLSDELRETIKTKKELIKKLKLDQETKNLIKIAEVFAYMQDERKKYVLIASHYENLFLQETQRRTNIDRNSLDYTIFPEIKDILKGKVDLDELEKRKEFSCVINDFDGYQVYSGKVAEEIFKKVFKKKSDEVNEFKGQVASKGKAKGIVKIIRTAHDLVNIHQGDILVTSMTRPEMVVAMKRAAAIVTDEGGITSHAAVVSRELDIPCVIGTKIATSVLKDGDFVEVDADKGIIKKIQPKYEKSSPLTS